jgi:hypothetical protein
MNGGILIIAVNGTAAILANRIAILIEINTVGWGAIGGIFLIGQGVAIVVDFVITDFIGTGVDVRILVVAIRAKTIAPHPIAITILVVITLRFWFAPGPGSRRQAQHGKQGQQTENNEHFS